MLSYLLVAALAPTDPAFGMLFPTPKAALLAICKAPARLQAQLSDCLKRLPEASPLNVLAFLQQAAFPSIMVPMWASLCFPSVRLGMWTWSRWTHTRRIHLVQGCPFLHKYVY